MAAKLFLAVVALLGIMWFFNWYQRAAPPKRNRALRNILLYGIAIALLGLAITGRLHWLFALIGVALPWVNRLLLLRQAFTWFANFKRGGGGFRGNSHNTTGKNRPPPGPPPTQMEISEAYQILGLKPGATAAQIRAAHRKLMNKMHPDRGGSDYLAARINRAKEILLNAL